MANAVAIVGESGSGKSTSLAQDSELGIIGFLTFYTMFFAFFITGIKSIKRETDREVIVYTSTITSYLLALIIFFQLYPGCLHSNYMWFSFGAIIALSRMNSTKKTAPKLQ